MEAALNGAVKRSGLASEIGRILLAADPETGSTYGTMLVGALTGRVNLTPRFSLPARLPSSCEKTGSRLHFIGGQRKNRRLPSRPWSR